MFSFLSLIIVKYDTIPKRSENIEQLKSSLIIVKYDTIPKLYELFHQIYQSLIIVKYDTIPKQVLKQILTN